MKRGRICSKSKLYGIEQIFPEQPPVGKNLTLGPRLDLTLFWYDGSKWRPFQIVGLFQRKTVLLEIDPLTIESHRKVGSKPL